MPPETSAANYEQLFALFQRRRCVREFIDKAVEPVIAEKILDAARTSPMGLPPSDENMLILDSKEKTRQFVFDFCEYLNGMRWFVSNDPDAIIGLIDHRSKIGWKMLYATFRNVVYLSRQ